MTVLRETDSDLIVAVEQLSVVHDRYDAQHSDPTGTSTGDDGENRDNLIQSDD